MTVLRWVVLVGLGLGAFFVGFDAVIDVEDTYATACQGRACPSIETEIYLLKLCGIITAIAIPAGLAWAFDRLDNRS